MASSDVSQKASNGAGRSATSASIANTAAVWGWDAWEAMERARSAGIPVLGCHHYLWPDPPSSMESQIDFWMGYVEAETPWWKEVPWIWQIDAEQEGLPRAPTRQEITRAVIALKKRKKRMASPGTTGYVIVYAPRWLYGNKLGPGLGDLRVESRVRKFSFPTPKSVLFAVQVPVGTAPSTSRRRCVHQPLSD
jgi:hypothetical protein